MQTAANPPQLTFQEVIAYPSNRRGISGWNLSISEGLNVSAMKSRFELGASRLQSLSISPSITSCREISSAYKTGCFGWR